MKDTEERRLTKAKISLMRNPKFALWSGILMLGTTEVVEDMPTAATDGRNEYYGREFVKSINDKQLSFVVLHENLHKAFRHLFVWRKLYEQNPRLANQACDYVINLILLDADPQHEVIEIPTKDGKPFILLDEQYRGMNTKQVYDLLKKDKGGEDGEEGGEGGDGGFDHHDWEKAKELSEGDKEKLVKEIDRAIRQGQIAAKRVGSGAGGLPRELGDLLEPQVDWREQLRDFAKSICSARDMSSWRRPNRRYLAQGIVMPSMISERIGKIVLGVDTSGSVGVKELNVFLSEVKALADELHPESIDLMYWGTSVVAHEVYTEGMMDTLVQSTRPVGGGGTDPRCVSDKIRDLGMSPECIIILTDGCIGDWGTEWTAPVLWVVAGNPTVTAPVGKTIHIKLD
jgi:predicted metal-dependent peptidase